jgi:hypothetical protein
MDDDKEEDGGNVEPARIGEDADSNAAVRTCDKEEVRANEESLECLPAGDKGPKIFF